MRCHTPDLTITLGHHLLAGFSVHPHSLDDVQVLPDRSVLVAEPLHPLDVKTNLKSLGTTIFVG